MSFRSHQVQIHPDDVVKSVVKTCGGSSHWVEFREGDSCLSFDQFLVVGATLQEAQRIADAINAAIEGAKSRAAADAEAVKIAAE